MAKLAVIPSDPIERSLKTKNYLESYYNPCKFFDQVYLLSPLEEDNPNLLGMKAVKTQHEDLKKMIRTFDIDVVRAYGGYWACDMACNNKVNGVPVVVSVHDKRPQMLHDSIVNADAVFCSSDVVKELVLGRFGSPDRVWVLWERVDLEIMHPYLPNELEDLDNAYPFRYRILHVGRKSREKNLDNVIRALRILGRDYCLLAIGMGDQDEYVELAEDQGVIGQCYFIGSIKNEELARYYSWTDCMCNPSRSEGFGMVFIEALACEAIVVTSDIAPMNEYIKHMENGLLVKDYENPQALAEMIKTACNDQRVRGNVKSNARKSVERFEKKRIDALEVEYYEAILSMKQEGRFDVPLWRQAFWSLGKGLRRSVPQKVKQKLRPYFRL